MTGGNMDWTDDDVEQATQIYNADPDDRQALRAVMTRAVELVQARGGTMTAERLATALAAIALGVTSAAARKELANVRAHLSAQIISCKPHLHVGTPPCCTRCGDYDGVSIARDEREAGLRATVATLQAKVAEHLMDLGAADARIDAIRAEAERLKEELAQQREAEEGLAHNAHVEYQAIRRRMETAESSLTAIRERAMVLDEALGAIRDGRRFRGEHTPEAIAKAALSLEGDAPQDMIQEMETAAAAGFDVKIVRRPGAPQETKACAWGGGECGNAAPAPCGFCSFHCGHARGICAGFGKRHPCSATCTHADARTPGHPERVRERSEAVKRMVDPEFCEHNAHVSEDCDRCAASRVRAAVEEWARQSFGEVPPTLKAVLDGES